MAESTFSRKLDGSGRIMIPVKLREQLGLVSGREYYFSVMEKDGRRYLCIDCGSDELTEAMRLVQSKGMKIVKNDD